MGGTGRGVFMSDKPVLQHSDVKSWSSTQNVWKVKCSDLQQISVTWTEDFQILYAFALNVFFFLFFLRKKIPWYEFWGSTYQMLKSQRISKENKSSSVQKSERPSLKYVARTTFLENIKSAHIKRTRFETVAWRNDVKKKQTNPKAPPDTGLKQTD